jgi:hypothetical protein
MTLPNKKGGRDISDTFDMEKWARAVLTALGHKPEPRPSNPSETLFSGLSEPLT